jgi:hypothetical protein
MRHERSPLPPNLIRAYKETHYVVDFDGEKRTLFRVDCVPLGIAPATSVTIITAWNPGLQRPNDAQNQAANAQLEASLHARQYTFFPAVGQSADGMHTEPSFAVLSLTEAEALALGREFGQAAVLYWDGTQAKLLWC